MVAPLAAEYAAAGLDRPVLRAQVAVAAVLGTGLAASLGWFDELRLSEPDELAALLVETMGGTGRDVDPDGGATAPSPVRTGRAPAPG